MTHLETHRESTIRYEKILTGILVCIGVFLCIAYNLGDGSVYGTGYELGKLISFTAGKIHTSIIKGIKISGTLLALFVSWKRNKSILWAILHAAFGWLYLLYFLYKERGQRDY